MSRRALAATLMTVGLASFCLLPFGGKPTDAQVIASTPAPSGRYQAVGIGTGGASAEATLVVIDTQTGECWTKRPNAHGPKPWVNLGSPAAQAGN